MGLQNTYIKYIYKYTYQNICIWNRNIRRFVESTKTGVFWILSPPNLLSHIVVPSLHRSEQLKQKCQKVCFTPPIGIWISLIYSKTIYGSNIEHEQDVDISAWLGWVTVSVLHLKGVVRTFKKRYSASLVDHYQLPLTMYSSSSSMSKTAGVWGENGQDMYTV